MITYVATIQMEEGAGNSLHLRAAHVVETKNLKNNQTGVRFLHKNSDVFAVLHTTAELLRKADSRGLIRPPDGA